jgi:hypothetical protein
MAKNINGRIAAKVSWARTRDRLTSGSTTSGRPYENSVCREMSAAARHGLRPARLASSWGRPVNFCPCVVSKSTGCYDS